MPPCEEEAAEKLLELESILGLPVWVLVEGNLSLSVMHPYTLKRWRLSKHLLPSEPVAILVDSFGGSAEAAYSLATLIRRRCGEFTAVIPRIAKSAGTLFALGATEIVLGEDAELGPLDVQFRDFDVEETMVSALDTVQAVEQLEQSAMEAGVKMLRHLANVTKKTQNILLPHAMHFAAEITKPLFEKIDAVRYSRQHRQLREAQEYAERLLQPRFEPDEAKAIAKELVRNYPTHEFVIDRVEAQKIGVVFDETSGRDGPSDPVGLQVRQNVQPELEKLLDWLSTNISQLTGAGRMEEVREDDAYAP